MILQINKKLFESKSPKTISTKKISKRKKKADRPGAAQASPGTQTCTAEADVTSLSLA
jgi:hypothetical protein